MKTIDRIHDTFEVAIAWGISDSPGHRGALHPVYNRIETIMYHRIDRSIIQQVKLELKFNKHIVNIVEEILCA
jgi:hypothetical protein